MKLSEAIRLGSMTTEKCIGERHSHDGAKCAIGAAEFAMGISPEEVLKSFCGTRAARRMETIWPFADKTPVPHPEAPDHVTSITVCIATLNNGVWHSYGEHGTALQPLTFTPWTREAIADWVATVEPQEAVKEEAVCIETPLCLTAK